MGYYDCITPSVILRNVFENPGWYTPYTPYQAEIAQGRLESLLNFQTVVKDLTGMDIATASLLDEGTAAAEAMTMFHRLQTKKAPAGQESVFLVSSRCFPQTIDVLRGRAEPLDIRLEIGDVDTTADGPGVRPAAAVSRTITARSAICGRSSRRRTPPACWSPSRRDLLALTLLTPPGEMGADAVVGNSQRFGVPLGYGGPHAAFFATRESFVRQAPGRIIGISVDARGSPGLPHGAADARAAHPPREGDVEHLHGAGAAREHRGDVCGVSRSRRACARSASACTTSRASPKMRW